MPPKGKKTKAEEALDFLSNLDNLDAPPPPAASGSAPSEGPTNPTVAATAATTTEGTPRGSTDSSRKSLSASRELPAPVGAAAPPQDDEAASALAFLEAQINQKRAPLSKPLSTTTPRSSTPQQQPATPAPTSAEPVNVPSVAETSPTPAASGWGVSSFWSTATSALQSAQRVADEQYQKVKTEGVSGVTGQLEQLGVKGVPGVDLNKLRKGAEERLGGIVKGVDLEKLRHDLLHTTQSTLTSILDTVAPPISAHETLELWLTHPMVGYAGVEGVIYRAWTRILEQTESGELIIVWSAPENTSEKDAEGGVGRSINPVDGWDAAFASAVKEITDVKAREDTNPQGRTRAANPTVPVTTIPMFLHLQPLLAPLPFPEPPILLSSTSTPPAQPKHLYFLLTLQDPQHSLRFSTVTQPSPADWMDVEYEKSEWVEERLVEVLRTGVEVIAQDYVATRMGLKPSAPTAAAAAALVEQASQEGDQAKVEGARAGDVKAE
ncbi:hypothetical protein IAR55_007060 [Kwoniella newhampshirensis]|uniref:Maintenance of telomere capping protein 1 n=1 Tax=Kwoniella newhampshirensis TaxID=1651941 RepID=A0AAW0YQ55_9TREE